MRTFLRALALLTPVLLALPASAADYPNRIVKLIVPFGAGGPADVYARILAKYMSEKPSSPSWSRTGPAPAR